MLNLLSELIETVNALVTFVINFITSMISFISYIPSYVLFITRSIAFMPAFLIPFATACISIYVMLFMIGRQG